MDETLFGEPLNKQLLARSKSMETISSAEDKKLSPVRDNRKKIFPRPKTALATMRVASRDPEFSPANTSPPPRRELAPVAASSIVISSSDWRLIREAARVMTPEERRQLEEGPGPGRA